jgi:hypothetical protein
MYIYIYCVDLEMSTITYNNSQDEKKNLNMEMYLHVLHIHGSDCLFSRKVCLDGIFFAKQLLLFCYMLLYYNIKYQMHICAVKKVTKTSVYINIFTFPGQEIHNYTVELLNFRVQCHENST